MRNKLKELRSDENTKQNLKCPEGEWVILRKRRYGGR